MSAEAASTVSAFTAAGGMRTEVTTPPRGEDPGLTAVSDVPSASGGTNDGPSPTQLLLAALAACKAMTARAYARRKEWPLEDVRVTVRHVADASPPRFDVDATLLGPLDDGQRERILQMMESCHVQKIIASTPRIVTRLTASA